MTKTYQHLAPEERGVIGAMAQQGCSVRAIARQLDRAPSTISRELRRNGHSAPQLKPLMGRPRLKPGYDAVDAGARAQKMRCRPRVLRKLHRGGELWKEVHGLLRHYWSPQQIAGKLRLRHPGRADLQASHETIYTAIYAMPRGTLRKDLVPLLRQAKSTRKPRDKQADRRGSLQDIVSIHLRPPEASDRLLPGHWEGDLIKGARNQSAVGTLVCRKTLFVMLVKMDGATAMDALKGFEGAFSPLDPELRQTLTYDQGKEMALHKKLAESTGMKIYFADPHSPWQRGINENTNGLLRQYLPKGTDLSVYSQRELDAIAWSLNNRPRASMGFKSPAEMFFEECFKHDADVSPVVALGL